MWTALGEAGRKRTDVDEVVGLKDEALGAHSVVSLGVDVKQHHGVSLLKGLHIGNVV